MAGGSRAAVVGIVVASALALGVAADAAPGKRTITVGNAKQFAAAVKKLRRSGGTIVLRPRRYRRLEVRGVVPKRPLRIVGKAGKRLPRVEQLLVDRSRWVSVGRVRIAPIRGEALAEVSYSRHVVLHDLVVSAKGTRVRAYVRIPNSRYVTIRRSDFSHCGDRSPKFANCVLLWRWSHHVLIEDNRFHDCFGCDFVHGRFGTHLTIRRNTFDRALPCKMDLHRCGHQDLVQLFAGRRLRVERNRFGVYRGGGAQLYLTNSVDYATIVNNVFVGTDPKVPGYRARMGIVVGSKASRRLPHHARIVNNTILSGARRKDGYAGSIRMSSRYGKVLRRKRPIVANNVIALFERRRHVCSAAQRFSRNVVINGKACSASDRVGPARLDRDGRPRRGSPVIDGADGRYAPQVDKTGRRRAGAPDIGAFEFRPRPDGR